MTRGNPRKAVLVTFCALVALTLSAALIGLLRRDETARLKLDMSEAAGVYLLTGELENGFPSDRTPSVSVVVEADRMNFASSKGTVAIFLLIREEWK